MLINKTRKAKAPQKAKARADAYEREWVSYSPVFLDAAGDVLDVDKMIAHLEKMSPNANYIYFCNGEADKEITSPIVCMQRGADGRFYTRYEGQLVDNKREGVFKSYHENTALEKEYNFLNDKQHGNVVEYFADGKTIRKTGQYVEGKKEGRFIGYYKDGKIDFINNYKGGKRHGLSIDFDTRGEFGDMNVHRMGKRDWWKSIVVDFAMMKHQVVSEFAKTFGTTARDITQPQGNLDAKQQIENFKKVESKLKL